MAEIEVSTGEQSYSIDISVSGQRGSVSVDRGQVVANVGVSKDLSQYYSALAKDWATREIGLVNNEDYSSKYYANKSKESAEQAKETAETITDTVETIEGYVEEVVAIKNDVETATEQAKQEITVTSEQAKQDLANKGEEVKQDIEDDIKQQVDYINDGITTIDDKLNKVVDRVLSHNMFDVVQKDHVLSFEESKGLVAFGDYAYKTGSDGTRYGYPDFYERCIKEYNEAKDYQMPYATKLIMNGNVVCRDTRTSEGKEGQIYLTNFSTENYASFNTYYGLPFAEPKNSDYYLKYTMSFRTGENISTQQCLFGWQYGIYLGINASKVHFFASSNGTSWNIANSKAGVTTLLPNTEYKVSLVNTNGHYMVFLTGNGVYSNTEIDISNTAYINTNNAQKMTLGLYNSTYPFLGDIIISDASYRNPVTGLYEFNDNGTGFYYEYSPDTVNDFDTVHYYYPLLTTPVKYHNNKHVYYNPIENIDRNYGHPIDYLYNQTGMAWLYGIDTTNERVRMPRNDKYFMCGTDAGTMVQAGLPNIEGEVGSDYTNVWGGAFYSKDTSYSGNAGSGKDYVAYFDASRSSSIYGNSDTVQTDAVKLMGYICVGNTESEVASTEVTEVTTTENDTIPLFTGMYFDFKPNNVSWLKADTVQAKSGTIYETAYNELVKCLNDVDNVYGIKVIDVADMVDGVDYSLYWKVDQVNMTFTTPSAISNKAYKDVALVAGNGMTLGLTTGSDTGGLTALTASGSLKGSWAPYGQPVGTATVSGQDINTNKSYGVTTDPTKSGIEAHLEENKETYLYFKVGNAVANKEIIDVGTLTETVNNKIDINSGYVDGQWEAKELVLSTATAIGDYELDLSDYLPKDNYCYEVMLSMRAGRSGSNSAKTYLSSSIVQNVLFHDSSSNAYYTMSMGNFPIGENKVLILSIQEYAVSGTELIAYAFRRLGKNDGTEGLSKSLEHIETELDSINGEVI